MPLRDVAIVGFAQSASVRRETSKNEVEMLMPILQEAKAQADVAARTTGRYAPPAADSKAPAAPAQGPYAPK